MPQHIEKLLKRIGTMILGLGVVLFGFQGLYRLWNARVNEPVKMTLAEFVHDRPESVLWFDLYDLELDIDHIVQETNLTNRLKRAYIPLRPRGTGESHGPAAVVLETVDPVMLDWIAALHNAGGEDASSISKGAAALVELKQTRSVSGMLQEGTFRPPKEDMAIFKIREWAARDCAVIAHQKRPPPEIVFLLLTGGALSVALIVVFWRTFRRDLGEKRVESGASPPPLQGPG